jgi:RNA-binding protein 15
MKALKNQHGRSVRSGSNKCQIGYGRSQVSPRLWIGGLGDWTTKEMLNKEFDRYGVIEQLEFTNDSQHAYIK